MSNGENATQVETTVRPDQAAYELVVDLVDHPASPSGDDLFDAVAALEKLTWSELWPTLERLAKVGPGLESMTYLEVFRERVVALGRGSGVSPRILAATTTVLLQQGGRTISDQDDFNNAGSLARAVVALSGRDQLEVLTRLGLSGEAAEGAVATMTAAALQAGITLPQPSLASALAIASFNFGDWDKPPNMPGNLYIGIQAHVEIAAYYKASHANDFVVLNYEPIGSIVEVLAKKFRFTPGVLSAALAASKPDIFDFSLVHPPVLYEIKPWTLAEVAVIEAAFYTTAFLEAGIPVIPGPVGFRGTFGVVPAPNGYFVFEAPVPGVIAYQYLQASRKEIKERDAKRGKQSQQLELSALAKAAGATAATGAGLLILAALLEALKDVGWIILFV